MKKRVLFICETVTLAHPMRTVEMARALDPEIYDVHLAAGVLPEFLRDRCADMTVWPLPSAVQQSDFLEALKKGGIPYDRARVEAQIDEDLARIRDIQPSVVVGDFRNSLGISARQAGVPYVNITNLTWHPDAEISHQVPDLPLVRRFGERLVGRAFRFIRRPVFRVLAAPFNAAARARGQREFGTILDLYTFGDYVFYADIPSVGGAIRLPPHHIVGGPILSSIQMRPGSTEFSATGPSRSTVVVSLGSSGQHLLVPQILRGLESMDAQVYVATAGQKLDIRKSESVVVADYLPLEPLIARSSLVITNGGSPTGYLALRAGVPFLAIPTNLDQFNFSAAIVQQGAAQRLRPEDVTAANIRQMVEDMLKSEKYRTQASRLRHEIEMFDVSERFRALIARITDQSSAEKEAPLVF